MMNFEIKNRFNGKVLFTCELAADVENSSYGIKLGFAVKKAVEVKADLSSANLVYADLSSADLSYANFVYADLSSANLRNANLLYADLSSADLRSADLSSADLRYANLLYANLSRTENSELAIAMTRILPEGQIIGWKKCSQGVIVRLSIPADAKRSSGFGRKCRAEFADVLEVIGAETARSGHDINFEYKTGERVVPDSFDTDFTNECSSGIHFFITRAEAEAYDL